MIRLSIRRPVAVTMAYLAVALLGVAAWRNIPIELLPDTELPQLNIQALWPGSSPEVTEAFLTSPIEAAVQQVSGVQKVTSTSSQENGAGVAYIQVEFAQNTDMQFARLDLSERLAALQSTLPPNVIGPTVQQYVPQEFQSESKPFLEYTITGPYTLEAIRAFVDDQITPELSQLNGVSEVDAQGGRARVLEIDLDEQKTVALGLNPQVVQSKIDGLDFVRGDSGRDPARARHPASGGFGEAGVARGAPLRPRTPRAPR
jgi:hydrophobic/amphiphilic exporter-1 (mainly G- bacteria), HAE1 family